ncbi:MAG: DinB family protein [Chloroflexota bacterium]
MLPDRKAAIREDLVEAQRGLLDMLDRVGSDDWQRRAPSNEGWMIRDVLVHLTASESGFVPTLRRMSAGDGGVSSDFDPDRWNASQLRRRNEMPHQQLRAELESAHAQMLALLDTLDAAALDHRGHLSSGGEGSTEDNFRLVASHKRTHTADIQAALASPPDKP